MAEEAVTTAKVTKVFLMFDRNSTQRSRAMQTITDGLAKNSFVIHKSMYESDKQLL